MRFQIRLLAMFAAFCLSALLSAQTCTLDTVVGTYAVSGQGTLIMTPPGASQPVAVPAAMLGVGSVDFEGAIAAPLVVQSRGGMISEGPMPATIDVNADCTGRITWQGGPASSIVILDGGDEIRGLISVAPPGMAAVFSGAWKRISHVPTSVVPQQCSPVSLHGTYAFSYQGIGMQAGPGVAMPAPYAMIGRVSFGYDGSVSGFGTGALGGRIVPFAMLNAKAVLNPDCTGRITATFNVAGQNMPGQAEDFFVVLDGGNEVWTIEISTPSGAGPITLGNWKRLSPVPLPLQ